jgi:hypothetical protein
MTPYERIKEKRIDLGLTYESCARTIEATESDMMRFEGGAFNALEILQIKSLLRMLGFWPWDVSTARPEEKADLIGLIGQIQAVESIQKLGQKLGGDESLSGQVQIVKKAERTRRGKEKRPGKGRRGSSLPRSPRPLGTLKQTVTLAAIQALLPDALKEKASREDQYGGELVYVYKGGRDFLLQIFTGFYPDGRKVEKASSLRITTSDTRSGYKVIHAFSGRLPLNSPNILRALREYLSIIIGEISQRYECIFCKSELKLKTVYEPGRWKEAPHARDGEPAARRPLPSFQMWKCATPGCMGSKPITLLPTLYKLRLSQWSPSATYVTGYVSGKETEGAKIKTVSRSTTPSKREDAL